MSHKRICATILALNLLGMSSPIHATGNAISNGELKDPLDFDETTLVNSNEAISPEVPLQIKATPALPSEIEQVAPLEHSPENPLQDADAGESGQTETSEEQSETELSQLEQTIRDMVLSADGTRPEGFTTEQLEALAEAYTLRDFRPVWFEDQSLLPLATQLIRKLRKAPAHGLDPQVYGVRQLASVVDVMEISNASATLEEIALVELQLSRAFAVYGAQLAGGAVKPAKVLKNVYIFPMVPSLNEMVTRLEEAQSVTSYFADLEPESPSYSLLKKALIRYDQVLGSSNLVQISEGPSIRPGESGDRILQLAMRLKAEGYVLSSSDYHGEAEETDLNQTYTDGMVEAVKRFQNRHGLTMDGIVGKKTRAALNASLEDRRNQILVNLERMRWDDPVPKGRYVKVNVAEQMVRIMEGTQVLYETRSVVGKPRHATPLFSDKFEYAEINPTWGVPWSIATNEYLPKLRKNASVLSSSGISVYRRGKRIDPAAVDWNAISKRSFNFQLRQKAGRRNALGAVKFMFPNKHNIYLHDTPSKRLFDKDQRAFSHGCIRVQDPFTFGEVLLAPSGHSRPKMERLRARGKTVRLNVKENIPVHLRYYTAFAGTDGELQFREDIYKQDRAILEALLDKQGTVQLKLASSN